MKLSDPTVKSLKATEARQEIPDDLLPGLYLTVQPKTGAKSWQVRYRASGRHRRMTLGRYPAMGLSDARNRAREVMRDAQSGADPAAEVRRARKEVPKDTVGAVLDDYAKRQLSKKKSGDLMKRELDRTVRANWSEWRLADVARRDVQDMIDDIADSGRGTTANRVLAYTKTFFAWAVGRDMIEANPAALVKKPVKETTRDRVLTNDEIRWFWRACEREGYPWGHMGQLLLLTGQRLREIAELTKGEINGESLSFAASRTKNGRPHVLPLSPMAFDLLEAMPAIGSANGYIFTTNGRTPVQGFHKGRLRLAAAMAEEAEKERGEPIDIPHWTFHDLRRTCATGMGWAARVEVIEKALNHVSGSLAGVAGTYNRHAYTNEMRDAMEYWAERITAILGNRIDEGGRIVPEQ